MYVINTMKTPRVSLEKSVCSLAHIIISGISIGKVAKACRLFVFPKEISFLKACVNNE